MKKSFATSITALLLALSLTACGEEVPAMTALDYELNLESNTTYKGITIGDTKDAFLEAYGDCDIETCVNGGPYQSLPTEEIPFEESIQTILPTFFIDGNPVSIEQICKENDIERTELLSFLSSEEYLNGHTVIYYYLVFTWENGAISDIRSEYMDYNKDAAYYEELEKTPAD
ncbi:MAG: hypothetical protein PUD93_00410 [Lachnospiraceae bacterium]|nr:hypothetical protein [Lachnospiraceae bacterium]